MLSIGIVGCGNHAQTHGRVVTGSADAEFVGCADVDAPQARVFANECGIPSVYGLLEDLFVEGSFDVLIITAVPTVHPEFVDTATGEVGAIRCKKPTVVGSV